MPYFARFKICKGYQFRFDTRIYLREQDAPGARDVCVAAVIGKNPGSAMPTRMNQLSEISLNGGKLLPTVRNRFLNAYERAGLDVPDGAFIRVWNLFYLCNPNLSEAITQNTAIGGPLDRKSEKDEPEIVWFAWGPPKAKLRPYYMRFLTRPFKRPFYFDITKKRVVRGMPDAACRVKHTQGMPGAAIEQHLAAALKAAIRSR